MKGIWVRCSRENHTPWVKGAKKTCPAENGWEDHAARVKWNNSIAQEYAADSKNGEMHQVHILGRDTDSSQKEKMCTFASAKFFFL